MSYHYYKDIFAFVNTWKGLSDAKHFLEHIFKTTVIKSYHLVIHYSLIIYSVSSVWWRPW